MAVPMFEPMLRPILDLATRQDITRRIAQAAMASHFSLPPADQELRTPSGSDTLLANRSGWAMTFLTKGRLIEKVAPKTYRATDRGREFLQKHPVGITDKDLQKLDGWLEAWKPSRSKSSTSDTSASSIAASSATPLEAIDAAVQTLHADVRGRLLDAILKQTPEFFERLVLDVLVKMGYGGSLENAAQHMGRSGDEGIDGRINQDSLGLDQILVQAKRYKPENTIDRKTIQAFIGSLAGQGVSKGIFITTSSYADTAREFVQRGTPTKIVLIDGNDLLDLMLQHRVGVRVERSISVLDIDHNYFEDEE